MPTAIVCRSPEYAWNVSERWSQDMAGALSKQGGARRYQAQQHNQSTTRQAKADVYADD